MDAQGAVDSLLDRLTTILFDEAQLLGSLRGDVEFIKDEMESMNSLLLHLTESQHRSHQVRTWMKHVVGLTRDCEGNVELYVRYVAGAGARANSKGLLGYLRRILQLLRTVPARHRVATRIRELKVRARDVGDRRLRYGVTVPPALPDQGRTIADKPAPQPGGAEEEDLRRRELLYGEPPDTVEEGSNQVLDWLLPKPYETADDSRPPKWRIIFIAGNGAVGKTSIARKVYEHPSVVSTFDHRVWLNIGGLEIPPDEINRGILERLVLQPRMDSLSEVLSGKRLLVILDALAPVYSYADYLVRHTGSAVIFTGRRFGCYAEKFDCETRARPRFFIDRARALATCEHSPILDVLKECYQDVFAMQMLLHLLYVNPQRTSKEMETLRHALANNTNTTAKVMLMFCYNELPINYKSCLLYLSIFPHQHIFRRTDLLRRWAAEGLIIKKVLG